MPRLNTPIASRPQYYDRNAVSNREAVVGSRAENQAITARWTYTVPADTKSIVGLCYLQTTGEVAATSSTTTDRVAALLTLTPSGGAGGDIVACDLNSAAYAAGDRQSSSLGSSFTLIAADVLVFADIFEGDAAGAGRVRMHGGLGFTEFNA